MQNDTVQKTLPDGALLLERANPGTSLRSYFPARANEAAKIASDLMLKLHQAPIPDHGFSRLGTWLMVLDHPWDIPLLTKARSLRDNLLQTSPPPALLHGNLHHDNMLNHHGQWVIIDPKGVIGDPAFEVTNFLRNPMPELMTLAQTEERLLTQLQVPRSNSSRSTQLI